MGNTMGLIYALGQLGPLALCLVAGSVFMVCMTIYFLGAHIVNQVVANATVARFKDGEIRFRPPKK
jgi:hypothetical protein